MIGFVATAAALLLVMSGQEKLRRPRHTLPAVLALLPALRRRRVPAIMLIRLVGAGELCGGALFVAAGGRVGAALLTAAYSALTAVAVVLFAHRPDVACGCFGSTRQPVGIGHLLLNVTAVAAAAACVALPVHPFGGALAADSVAAIGGVVQVVLIAALAYLSVTALPALAAAGREAPAQ